MKKRLLALTMAMVLAASTLVACGGETPAEGEVVETPGVEDPGTEDPGEDPGTSEPEPTEPIETAVMEAPSTEGWDESMKIYYYSWNDEFGSRMQYVLDAYPEYADYVEYVNLGVSGTDGTYQTAVDTAMTAGDAYPSIIAMDNDIAKYYLESDVTLTMEEIGITNDMYANAYQYTIDYATVDGQLKGLTWQATPGCFIYRYDIAQEVLGVCEPEDVQAYVADWDAFFETAETMKAAGYFMTSGPDEVKYAIWDQQTQPWVLVAEDGSETLQLDSAVTDYLETAKRLYDGGYTDNSLMWSEGWNANYEGDVFGYFGCTWSLYWCMVFNMNEDGTPAEDSTYGNWRVCQGPVSYHWGGTYVAVTEGCPNTELAAFLIYSLCCDPEIMYTLSADTLDFVNNKEAIANLIADGCGASDALGGQNPVETWAEAALSIDLSNATYLDAALKVFIDNASQAYNAGEIATVEEAVAYVEEQVATTYDYITVE